MFENSTATEESNDLGVNVTEKIFRPPYDDFDAAVTSGILLPLAVFGVAANVTTIIVVYLSPNLRSVFNYYIMSLCFSDLISAVISPLWIYRRTLAFLYDDWKLPFIFCKIYWVGDSTTSVSTSFHIVAFSGLRLLSIAKPHVFNRIKLASVKKSIFCIWMFSIGFAGVPNAIFMSVNRKDRYSDHESKGWPTCSASVPWSSTFATYNTYSFIFLFYIPLAIIFVQSLATSILICFQRSQRKKKRKARAKSEGELNRRRKENRAILQISLVVGSFATGYLPTTIFLSAVTTLPVATYEDRRFIWLFGAISFICLRVSECLNPIFYNLASSKLRGETTNWLRKVFGCKKCKPQAMKERQIQLSNLAAVSNGKIGIDT